MSGESTISEARKRFTAQIERFSAAERRRFDRALSFAEQHHAAQRRRTGEPYICHPIEVATILCDWKLDAPTVTAAILHDIPEDTAASLDQIQDAFGEEVAELVGAVTKLSAVRIPAANIPYETEHLRRLLIAMARDVRVILLKLADRLHNIRTFRGLPTQKRLRYGRETIEIFAPLADRLGMGEVRAELADRGFECAHPKEFAKTKQSVDDAIKHGARYLAQVRRQFAKALADKGITAQIDARTKTLYSLYQKLQEKARDLDKVYDLFAVRVIVGSVEECYQGMGVIHRRWQPLPHRIKDYIAVPKSNGYRSLHTTVFGPRNRLLEIQFRTWQMHNEAEHGIAAHAVYADHKRSEAASNEQVAIMQQLRTWQEELDESPEFVQRFKLDLFSNRIFVFTPHGTLHSLPAGSCPIDFAFAVHTEVGYACKGAKVNGVIVPLDTKLANGDVVEILRGKQRAVKQGWLSLVRTGHARSAIRRELRVAGRDAQVAQGGKMLMGLLREAGHEARLGKQQWRELITATHGAKTEDDVRLAIAEGRLTPTAVRRALSLVEPKRKRRRPTRSSTTQRAVIAGDRSISATAARCCKPVAPEPIVRYLTLRNQMTIHRRSCPQIRRAAAPERLVSATWDAS